MEHWDALFSDTLGTAACVDWRAESIDVLFAVRETWMQLYPALTAATLDELTENYAAETCELYLPALGQELTTLQLRLYALDSDGDDYRLAVVAENEAAAFEQAAKVCRHTLQWQKQARRKPGESARRLKLADRLPFRKMPLANEGLVQVGAHALVAGWGDPPCGWIALETWPPAKRPMSAGVGILDVAHHAGTGLCAAIFIRDDEPAVLRMSYTPWEADSWEAIATEEALHELSKLAFADDDLWIARGATAWCIKGAACGACEVRRILQAEPDKQFEYPGFARSGDGRSWLLLAGMVYACEQGQLRKTALPLRPYTDFHCMPTDRGFAYVARMGEAALIELDATTGQERLRPLQHLDRKTTIREFAGGWAMLLRWGVPEREFDLAQFWHPQTDRWLRLPYGALGAHGLGDMLLGPQTEEVWARADKHVLLNLGDFDALLQELTDRKSGVLQPPPWSEWSDPPRPAPVAGMAVPVLSPTAADSTTDVMPSSARAPDRLKAVWNSFFGKSSENKK